MGVCSEAYTPLLQEELESGTGMLSHIASQYPIPALLHYDCFQSSFSTCLSPYYYTDTVKALPSAGSVTQPPPPVPVRQIAAGEVWDRCEGVSGRSGESSPDTLVCGMRAAIGEHTTGLGICVIVAVPDASEHLPHTSPAASTLLKLPIICSLHFYRPASSSCNIRTRN